MLNRPPTPPKPSETLLNPPPYCFVLCVCVFLFVYSLHTYVCLLSVVFVNYVLIYMRIEKHAYPNKNERVLARWRFLILVELSPGPKGRVT